MNGQSKLTNLGFHDPRLSRLSFKTSVARFQSFRIAPSDHPRNPELSTYMNDAYSLKIGVDHFSSVTNTTVSEMLVQIDDRIVSKGGDSETIREHC